MSPTTQLVLLAMLRGYDRWVRSVAINYRGPFVEWQKRRVCTLFGLDEDSA